MTVRWLTLVIAIHLYVSVSSMSVYSDQYSGSPLADDDGGELLFATILYRHGDRTPIEPYPSDPYKSPSFWNHTGWGELTNEGKRQHYELGKWLKQRYHSLVNETYNPEDIWVRSTDVDRALMSAQANLAGFYPPEDFNIWSPTVQWQPIPVHTTPTKQDKLIYMGAKCPRYDYLYAKYLKSDEHRELKKKYKKTFDTLTKYTNKTVNSFKTAQQVWGVMVIESIHQMKLPEWTKEVFPDPITEMSAIAFQTPTMERDMARLVSGPLLMDMLKGFQMKVEGKMKPNRGIWMYSAHDTTVSDLLNTLRVFDPPHNPPFTATVLLELRMIEKEPHVALFYKKGVDDAAGKQMVIPNCGLYCPLKKMFELYEDVLPRDWDEECRLGTLTISYEDAQIGEEFGGFYFWRAMCGGRNLIHSFLFVCSSHCPDSSDTVPFVNTVPLADCLWHGDVQAPNG